MRRYLIAGLTLLPVMMVGCATSGGQDMMNTVYNTNRIVRNLEQNLTPTVNKLNQTTADLGARVDASEQETSRMAQQLETTTALLQDAQQKLENIEKMVYRNAGMSPPRAGAPATGSMQVGPMVEENPDAASGAAPVAPAPGPMAAVPGAGAPNPDDMLDNPGVPAPIGPTQVPIPTPGPAPAPPVTEPPAPSADAAAGGDAGQDLYKQAGAAFYAGNYDQAKTLYDQYLQQYPSAKETPNAQFWKGEAQLKLNNYQDAIKDFEKLRKSYPTNTKVPYSMYEQAEAHLQLGQTNEAVALLKQLIAEWPMTRPATKAKADLEKRGIQ